MHSSDLYNVRKFYFENTGFAQDRVRKAVELTKEASALSPWAGQEVLHDLEAVQSAAAATADGTILYRCAILGERIGEL